MEKKLFLLDAYALIYRSYYAFINNPRINSKGLNTSAIFGFTNTLHEILVKEKPTHIAIAFDPKDLTFRNDIFPQYKAQRPPTPEDIKLSIPLIRNIIDGFNIKRYEIDKYEADDVIGTLAKIAKSQGFVSYMMTPDKDYCQLVEEGIFLYKPRHKGNDIDIMGVAEVKEKFGIENPMQVIDILGLWGDASDNIPGAPGIGEKTSQQLIAQYKSIEGIYQNIGKLKGKQKENLLKFKELNGLLTEDEKNRWETIKELFMKQQKLKGFGANNQIAQLLQQVEILSDGIIGIKNAMLTKTK